jgi:hypothetical protein
MLTFSLLMEKLAELWINTSAEAEKLQEYPIATQGQLEYRARHEIPLAPNGMAALEGNRITRRRIHRDD